jgi:phage terminase small subunit
VHATRLLRRPEVAAAVDRVRAALAERARYTLDQALHEINEDLAGARSDGQWSAVASMQTLKQKLVGHLVERIDARVQQVPFRIELHGFEGPPIEGTARVVEP